YGSGGACWKTHYRQKLTVGTWAVMAVIYYIAMISHQGLIRIFQSFIVTITLLLQLNARLRGWQRINAKLKHNNCNHRGSLGLETLRVDSPS
ncbi:hypothetical protein BC355_19075, partial [Vibrio cholerae]